jgi:hypothetical protein
MWNLGLHLNIICGLYISLKTKGLFTCFPICKRVFCFQKWMSLVNSMSNIRVLK